MDVKSIDQRYSVSDQLTASDLDTLAAQGITLVVNFRPDGEGGESQPTSATLAEKASSLGIAYAHIPVVPNQIQPAHAQQLQTLLSAHPGPVVGFCRTGNRANQVYQLGSQASAASKPACCSQPAAQDGLINKVKSWFHD